MARGGDEDEEERSIEQQLEQQLKEQKDSLSFVNDALASDPSNADLITVRQELILAIKDAEEGLLELKRSRMLKEADAIFLKRESDSIFEDAEVEQLDPSQVEPEPLEAEDYSVGSKCRFRHTDGRWYNGHIMGFEGIDSARISFLTPISESMLEISFFMTRGRNVIKVDLNSQPLARHQEASVENAETNTLHEHLDTAVYQIGPLKQRSSRGIALDQSICNQTIHQQLVT